MAFALAVEGDRVHHEREADEVEVFATAARIVNAISAVIDAAPGFATAFQLRLGERMPILAVGVAS